MTFTEEKEGKYIISAKLFNAPAGIALALCYDFSDGGFEIDGTRFKADYYRHGGIMQYVLRNLL